MSNYVMSDIHGEYKCFEKMLELINFNDNYNITIIGGAIDRVKDSIKLIKYIMTHDNVELLKGNHEKMFQDYFTSRDTTEWFANGGKKTRNEIRYKGLLREAELYQFIKSLQFIRL